MKTIHYNQAAADIKNTDVSVKEYYSAVIERESNDVTMNLYLRSWQQLRRMFSSSHLRACTQSNLAAVNTACFKTIILLCMAAFWRTKVSEWV